MEQITQAYLDSLRTGSHPHSANHLLWEAATTLLAKINQDVDDCHDLAAESAARKVLLQAALAVIERRAPECTDLIAGMRLATE